MAGQSSSAKTTKTPLSRVKGSRIKKPAVEKKDRHISEEGSQRTSSGPMFGYNTVTRYLRIPQTGNFTGAEVVAFLPELLRSYDVLIRLMRNVAGAGVLLKLVNWYRAMPKGDLKINSMSNLVRSAISHRQGPNWKQVDYRLRDIDQKVQATDHSDMTFNGAKNYSEDNPKELRHQRSVVTDVPFPSLATDVRVFPSGDDELDLSRCVKTAVANVELALMFPRDYDWLTNFLGGARKIRPANRDSLLFQRWSKVDKAVKPSAQHVQDSFRLDQYVFTTDQKAQVEEYLRQFTSPGMSASTRVDSVQPSLALSGQATMVPSVPFVAPAEEHDPGAWTYASNDAMSDRFDLGFPPSPPATPQHTVIGGHPSGYQNVYEHLQPNQEAQHTSFNAPMDMEDNTEIVPNFNDSLNETLTLFPGTSIEMPSLGTLHSNQNLPEFYTDFGNFNDYMVAVPIDNHATMSDLELQNDTLHGTSAFIDMYCPPTDMGMSLDDIPFDFLTHCFDFDETHGLINIRCDHEVPRCDLADTLLSITTILSLAGCTTPP